MPGETVQTPPMVSDVEVEPLSQQQAKMHSEYLAVCLAAAERRRTALLAELEACDILAASCKVAMDEAARDREQRKIADAPGGFSSQH